MTDAELAGLLREHALLEGDFVLRSGRRSSYYLDKYRFETRPDLLKELGERIAVRVRESAPDARRLAGPELGAVALAASASLAGNLPFLIVRKEAKGYGTERRIEGEFEAGEEVCLLPLAEIQSERLPDGLRAVPFVRGLYQGRRLVLSGRALLEDPRLTLGEAS